MTRRLFVAAIAFIFILTTAAIAFADDAEKVKNTTKGTSYTNLKEAVAAADAGDSLSLTGDLSISESVTFSKPLSLDLNGHNITSDLTSTDEYGGNLFTVSAALTLKGGGGSIESRKAGVRAFSVSAALDISDTTIEGFTTTSAQVFGQGAAINANDGKLKISNCTFKNNSALGITDFGGPYDWMYRISYKPGGGAIALLNVSAAEIRNSTFDGNKVAELGGAILLMHDTGALEVYDSVFKNNTSTTGGAIAVFSSRKTIIEGNTFENNSAWDEDNRSYVVKKDKPADQIDPDDPDDDGYYYLYYSFASGRGGAIFLLPDSRTETLLKDNMITGNKANRGGGISIGSDTQGTNTPVKIESGIFEKNHASAGGAIDYTVHNLPPLELQDVLITGNSAVRGGGVWLCPQGSIDVSSALGGTVVNNSVSGSTNAYNRSGTIQAAGDDIAHEGSDSKDVKPNGESAGGVTVSTRGPGGVKVDWYTDEADSRYKNGSGTKAIDAIAKSSYPDIFAGTDKSFGIHAVIPGVDDKDRERLLRESEKGAKIIIRNNTATRGGGIAANSPITFGEKDVPDQKKTTIDLTVKKKWNGKETASEVYVDLIRYDVDEQGNALSGGDRVVLDRGTVISKEGDWYTFYTDLPLEYTDSKGNRRLCRYTIEEQSSSAYRGKITGVTEEDSDVTIELTNTPTAQRKGAQEEPSGAGSQDPSEDPSGDGVKSSGADTSDHTGIMLYLGLLGVSLVLVLAIIFRRRFS